MGRLKWSKATRGSDFVPGSVNNKFVSRKQERKKAKELKKLQSVAFHKHQKVEKVIAEKLGLKIDKKKATKKPAKSKTEKILEQLTGPAIQNDSDEESIEPEAKRTRHGSDSDDSDANLTYEQYLKETKEKKQALIADGDPSIEDDAAINKYAKLLNISKRVKNGITPKVFQNEGLDVLLDFCDVSKRQELLANEKNDIDILDDLGDDDGSSEDDNDEKAGLDLSEGEDDLSIDNDDVDEEDDFDDEEQVDEENEAEEQEVNAVEDMYGRQVNARTGELIKFNPLAARKKLEELDQKTGTAESRLKLDRTITGIINRLSEATIVKSKQTIEELWASNSKNDVKSSITKILCKMIDAPFRLQDSLLSTYGLFLALLHATISSEISSHFVECVLVEYVKKLSDTPDQDDKSMENRTVIVAHLMNFRIVKQTIILDVMKRMRSVLNVDNLQIFYTLCVYSYKNMKRNAWLAFVNEISETHIVFQNAPFSTLPRARFLGDQVLALKKSAPDSVDLSIVDHHWKMFQGLTKKVKTDVEKELGMGLDDLLNAETRGRWWVVGSAFRLPTDSETQAAGASSKEAKNLFSDDILALAVKAKMNTQIRKNIFCTIATASDEDEAFEKLLRMSLKGQQERELIYVPLLMMLKEKQFNRYYPTLIARFCEFDRRFQMTTQFAIWDRVKELTNLKSKARSHFAVFLHQIISGEVLQITVLKIVEWGMLTPAVSSVLKKLFTVLEDTPLAKLRRIFTPILDIRKNANLSEGVRLFLQIHFGDSKVYNAVDLWFTGL